MPEFLSCEWDHLLRSAISLSSHVGFRFDASGNRCLYDLKQAKSWRLENWQSRLLEQIHRGESFNEAVRNCIQRFPVEADRQEILTLVRGLQSLGFLKVGRPSRPSLAGKPREIREVSKRLPGILGVPESWIYRMAAGLGLVTALGWAMGTGFSWEDLSEARVASASFVGSLREPLASEARVDPYQQIPIKAWSHGVITEVFVDKGDIVTSGQVIAKVVDPAVQTVRNDKRLSLSNYRSVRDEAYGNGEMESYHAATRSIARLTRDLSRWEASQHGSEIVAPVTGRVISPNPSQFVGDRVEPGAVVLTIESSPLLERGTVKNLVQVVPPATNR